MSKEYLWGGQRRFNSYPEFMRKKFGGRVQKLTIDAGFSCPNRDGTKGYGGCTFCLNDAFNPSYCTPSKTITRQISEGIEFHEKRYRRAEKYLAYFQAFSNTHASIEILSERYHEALNCKGVIGLVIGTRPDCMDPEKLDLLLGLAEKYHIVVEYGIETVYNKTLNRINRCHTFEDTRAAIEMTARSGIHVGGHIIFGLPGESRQEMLESASVLSSLPLGSVKFHQLQIFRGTEMEDEYHRHPEEFNMPGEDEYLDFMVEYIERLNPAMVVERIAGETPPRYAVRQPWGPRYDQVLVKFERLLEERDTWQGRKFDDLMI